MRDSDLLCRFAMKFPGLVAEILERSRGMRREIREETITDLMMASLTSLAPLGIVVNFPRNESLTGQDMDWEFVNEGAKDQQCYLRLHIQAKRAKRSQRKAAQYWYYAQLDYAGAPKPHNSACKRYGTQHSNLVKHAKIARGCVPLYMFYHSKSTISDNSGSGPQIEGINWMFASDIPECISPRPWPTAEKKVERWKTNFFPLSDLLCFSRDRMRLWNRSFMKYQNNFDYLLPMGPTPTEVAQALNECRKRHADFAGHDDRIRAVKEIPASTLQGIQNARVGDLFQEIDRPRVIFRSGYAPRTA